MNDEKEICGVPKERLKRIAAWFIFLLYPATLIISAMLAFGVVPILRGCGMGIFIIGCMLIANWALTTLGGEYPTHYGADPPC